MTFTRQTVQRLTRMCVNIFLLTALLVGLIPLPMATTIVPTALGPMPLKSVVETATNLLPKPAVVQAASFGPYDNTIGETLANQASCGGGDMTRTISVDEDFTVDDLNVGINGEHTFRGSLRFALTSPVGTSVTLITQSTDNFDDYNLLLDDESIGAFNDGQDDMLSPLYDLKPQRITG